MLIAIRSRQRTTRNLGAQRAAVVFPEQLGQLLRDAVLNRAYDWLHSTTITTVEQLLDRCHGAASLSALVASLASSAIASGPYQRNASGLFGIVRWST
jgi:hypothetical protein